MTMEEEGPDVVIYIGFGVAIFFLLYVLRQWIKGKQFTEKVNAKGKVAIVTGASSGIGRQLVRELNLRYVKVYMMCRSVEKGRQTTRDLAGRYGCHPDRMIVMEGDLTSFESIRKFVKEFEKEEEKLDILINNAGVMFHPKFEKTMDGNELTWQSNYLGHFLLTELLLPKLEKCPDGGRIVNVSSEFHKKADTVDMDVCNDKKKFDRWIKTYARSKLANVMHAVALTKRIRAKDSASKISVNSCHPGVVNTDLVPIPLYRNVIKKIFLPLIWFIMKTEQDGAQTPLYLALSKKVNGISGKYFSESELASAHSSAEDENACEVLYNSSVEACQLDQSRY
ncbi:short chain dehydrogenase domain-containing protein [Ditylenchus destructor]|nr:short chain dehydrogenase domain-containing protein [Ditylenchus destructor]